MCFLATIAPRFILNGDGFHQIGADGYNSPVRTYSSIGTFGWAYNANGVVASVRVAEENRGDGMTTAWQRFLPQGPIAFLPVRSFLPAFASQLFLIL
jgi:2-polyprenyl-6-methoxyphenol hydroxylase-like FAD-dependent oxidoreductase